ncbi:MAG: TonB-dependent receptor plug domain-containing protein, partial [Phenylobacterium sp.]
VLVGSGLAWRTTAAGAYVVESAPRAGFQEAEGGPAVSEVVVTGSRVIRDGSAAPTPLTVVSLEQLREAAPATIADALNQLPVFQNSLRPTTAGSSATGAAGNGGNYLNLRSLGPARTLVLLDGRRSAPSNTTGTTDVNLFPQLLVQRVDVVTGGASAAYGSDAVTGVVNFALDNDFSGWKAELQGGVSGRGDNKSVRAALAHGRPVLDGRGHLLLSAEYFDSAGIGLDYGGRRWAEEGWSVIPNPSGPPSQLFAPDLALSDAAPGGLIVSPGPLAGTLFLAGGATRPAQFGAFRSTSTMSGGDGARPRTNLVTGVETATLFGRFDYNLADGLNAFLQVALSEVETSFPTAQANWQSGGNRFTIFSGNPFLPANIQAVMTAQNIASFSMGRFNSDWVGGEVPTSSNLNRTHSLVAGLEGKLAGSWNWSAYAAHGRSREKRVHTMLPVMMNLYRAADAVRAPDGRIVCRSTLTTPADGCVPINLFGPGSAS